MLPGQDTLLANWAALATTLPGARLVRTDTAAGSVFPAWAPLNNVIVLGGSAARVAAEWRRRYAEAGVPEWALWMPSRATTFEAPDELGAIPGMRRDETTLVMSASIPPGLPRDDGVVRTSLGTTPGLATWVLMRDGHAVVNAWTQRHGTDCGIYAVETEPAWRGKGLATALMRHVMAEAAAGGAHTATLQSTRMGRRLYESLGFVAVGRYEEWVSADPRAGCGQGDY
jgi:GNAT superfamily N-acetyltransferase